MRVYTSRPLIERFLGKIVCDLESQCWLWDGRLNSTSGYATFSVAHRDYVAGHRWSYEYFVGPIPNDRELDHVCRVRRCVNPAHLRIVTRKQNSENRGIRSDNASGYSGVNYHPKTGRWIARVGHHGDRIYLGLFDTAEEAGEAARLKRLELFTHNDVDRNRA